MDFKKGGKVLYYYIRGIETQCKYVCLDFILPVMYWMFELVLYYQKYVKINQSFIYIISNTTGVILISNF